MYVPPAFRMDDLPAIHDAMRAAPLATLVTATDAGLMATPLPLLLDAGDGPFGTVHGYLARANQQWERARGEALATFAGPDAYVTPSWYAREQEHGRVVPTWNHVAVHAYGVPEFFDDEDRLLDAVTRLTAAHEGARPEPSGRGRARALRSGAASRDREAAAPHRARPGQAQDEPEPTGR